MPKPTSIHLSLEPTLEGLAKLSEGIDHWATEHGLTRGVLHTLQVSVEELVVNVINHGFDTPHRPPIDVTLTLNGAEICFTLEDQAKPFDPTQAPIPKKLSSLEDAPIGGWGIQLVREFSTAMHYQRLPGGNKLVVHFSALGPPPDSAAPSP